MSAKLRWLLFVLLLAEGLGPHVFAADQTDAAKMERLHESALALYPSPLLAPVKHPYYILWYLPRPELWRQLKHATVTTYDNYQTWLHQQGGILNLTWGEGGPVGWLPDEEAWVSYYLGIAGSEHLGYCMHEWHFGSDDDEAQWATAAVRQATQQHPQSFSAFYYQGQSPMAELAAEGNIDLLIIQGYMNVHKDFHPVEIFQTNMAGTKTRVDISRKTGAIEQTIVMIGHICNEGDYHEGHELTPELLEQQIKELRSYAPEMPGIGFYHSQGDLLALECDRLVAKYFIDPAPDVLIEEPLFQAKISAPQLTVRANATAKGGRSIARYRWFIDNRLVAETKEPEYLWAVNDEINGHHFITVHAVDSGFNRAAAQILVTVERARQP